jgi:hypothetical protein
MIKPEVLEALRKQRTHRDIDETHEEMILCPECECQYNHIIRVGTELGTDECEAEIYQGTNLIFENATSERRSSLRVEYWCEGCHHLWHLVLIQHKGLASMKKVDTHREISAERAAKR